MTDYVNVLRYVDRYQVANPCRTTSLIGLLTCLKKQLMKFKSCKNILSVLNGLQRKAVTDSVASKSAKKTKITAKGLRNERIHIH